MRFLIKLFIKNHEQVQNKKVREQYGVLSGIVGIFCNLLLFAVKLAVGFFSGSMAILADAFNNLTDCGSSAVSIVGAKMSNRLPDREHPFGHGRIEYVSSLIVSFIIILVGFELLKSSAHKLLHPTDVSLSTTELILLCLAILTKIWMYFYNRYIGKKINSIVLLATAKDSLNDCVATIAVIASALIAPHTTLPVDGIVGIFVSLFIMYGGFSLSKNTIGILLGNPASKETVEQITDIILSADGITGMHDLIIHDYGPGRVMASVHAEVSDKADIVAIHETIDALENHIQTQMDIHIVVHMDPISYDDSAVNALREFVSKTISALDPALSFHDLRITSGENNRNLLFDLVMPCDYKPEHQKALKKQIQNAILEYDNRYNIHIKIDNI
ncbi:MAG: cation transporter [Clostridia bacterium]|nr:cation transporter [Clostridia bacterium]